MFKDFVDIYIMSDMTEYQKMEKCAWYIQALYECKYYKLSLIHVVISGGGDCLASCSFMEYLARYKGLKTAVCSDFDCHGITIVQTNSKNYLVITGLEDEKL